MKTLALLLGLATFFAPAVTGAQLVAERVTADNAAVRLFGGSDADGGIDDWYVSNGVVEAIIDDVGVQNDLIPLVGSAAPPRQSEAAVTGGTLLDLGLVGRHNDQLGQFFSVAGLSASNFIAYEGIAASVTGSSATITVTGVLRGYDTGPSPVPPSDLVTTTEYTAAGSDRFLTITTTVSNRHPTNDAANLGGLLDPIIWTERGVIPFSPLRGRAFNHGIFSLANPLVALETPAFAAGPGNLGPDDGVMDTETGAVAGEVAYGLLGVEVSVDQDGAGGAPAVVTPVNMLFGVSNNTTTALGNVPAATRLAPGGVLVYTRRLYVGDRNDVASVANLIIPELASRQGFGTGTISGDVDALDAPAVAASVIATKTGGPVTGTLQAGAPITQFRTDAAGAFSGVVLPEGTYDLQVRAPERDVVTVSGITVTAGGDTAVAVPPLAGVGTLALRVVERGAGTDVDVPGKVVFRGLFGTPDPVFHKDVEAFLIPPDGSEYIDLLPETFAGGRAQRNVLYVHGGVAQVDLRPGTYELLASRGPEYSVRRARVRVKGGRTKRRTLKLRRLVDTAGMLSADFHVHSARSFDASAPLVDRVVSFAAEGVEALIATDHDFNVDYAPVIASLGLGAHIASIVGNEVTTSVPNPPAFPASLGHINAWPMRVDAAGRRDGAIEDEYVAPNLLYSRLRAGGAEVVQYNHPRATLSGLTSLGIFTNVGYDPDVPLTAAPNDILLDRDILGPGRSGVSNPDGYRNIDFDVLEIANGLQLTSYLEVRRDWLSLLNQTDLRTVPFIPGTAVSDSHRLTVESPGYFRTYVGGVGDDPAALDVSTFDRNVKAGNMVGTNGPAVTFAVRDAHGTATAGLGQTLVPAGGDLLLDIRVEAANWMPLEEVRVIANGHVAMAFDAGTSPSVSPPARNPYSRSRRTVRRFAAAVPVTVTRDTYFIVEAGMKLDPLPEPPELADRLVPGLIPLAFTNPIFVDLGGDGFDPPGLPVMATAASAGERPPAFARVNTKNGVGGPRGWWQAAAAVIEGWGAARAGGQYRVPSGPEQRAAMERARTKASDEYFPLYHFAIPPSAVEAVLAEVPEPTRSYLRAQRRAAQGR